MSALDKMIGAGSPPDLVLDLTHGGQKSEAVKSLTNNFKKRLNKIYFKLNTPRH